MQNIGIVMACMAWADQSLRISSNDGNPSVVRHRSSRRLYIDSGLLSSVEWYQVGWHAFSQVLLTMLNPATAFAPSHKGSGLLTQNHYAQTIPQVIVSARFSHIASQDSLTKMSMAGSEAVIQVRFNKDVTLQCYQSAANSGERIYLLPAVLLDGMMRTTESALRHLFGDEISFTTSDDGWLHELHLPGRAGDAGSLQAAQVVMDELQKIGLDVALEDGGGTLVATPHLERLTETILTHARMMREQKDPSRFASELSRQFLSESEVRQFWREGAVIVPGALQRVLGDDAARMLHAEISRLASDGFLAPPSSLLNRGAARRSDLIGFMNEHAAMHRTDPPLPTLATAITLMKGVVHELNNAGLRSMLVNPAQQIASFEPGGRYERHVDLLTKDSTLDGATLILYANDADWPEEAGGQLRLHDWPTTGKSADVLPCGGTLVAFRSPAIQHEILPTLGRKRLAVTLWAQEEDSGSDQDWLRSESAAEKEARQYLRNG